MFHEELVDLFDSLSNTTSSSSDGESAIKPIELSALHTTLTEENATSDYCTWYLRLLTASHLKSDPDRFVHFLEGDYYDVPTFCAREVEPMHRECGMVQVLALAEVMQVDVVIEYMDGRSAVGGGGGQGSAELVRHEFGPSASSDGKEKAGTTITLLYRPGHYDILYR